MRREINSYLIMDRYIIRELLLEEYCDLIIISAEKRIKYEMIFYFYGHL